MPTPVKVYEVKSVHLVIYKMLPPTLGIHAVGVVPTTGYSNGQLIPWIYIQPPQDGIWDFDFVADKPDGPQLEVLCDINASYYWREYPKDLKGVRIHASCNEMEALLSKGQEVTK